MNSNRRRVMVTGATLALALGTAACGSSSSPSPQAGTSNGGTSSGGSSGSPSSQSGGKAGKIALLLPESKTTRYEAFDRPLFQDKIAALCSGCEVLYSNADQDATKQQSQAEAALTNGAKVLVLDPVDGKSAQSIVTKAKAQGVPVISYDRLANGPVDYYVSFDNEKVGVLQGDALLTALKAGGDPKRGPIVMINGSPTDPNAAMFKKGAHSALDGKVTIGREFDTPDWSPDKAQQEMQQALTALGQDKIIGVYAANDGTAGGAIAAMKGAGMTNLPPVTGQDAELAGIQRIIAGQQYMTIYKSYKKEAEAAAQMAIAALNGKTYDQADRKVNNGSADVPSLLLPPVVVKKDNVKSTVVKDGLYTVAQICTTAYADACKKAGLSG